jgi:hypothetical protein
MEKTPTPLGKCYRCGAELSEAQIVDYLRRTRELADTLTRLHGNSNGRAGFMESSVPMCPECMSGLEQLLTTASQ